MYRDGLYKLGDLGIACRLTPGTQPDSEGDGRYLAPELLREDWLGLAKADVFALGARYTVVPARHARPSRPPTHLSLHSPSPARDACVLCAE
jgi:hypothetical protein